jgi:hypothetical protein
MKTELVDLINTTPGQDTIGNHHVLLHKMQYSLEELWDIAQTLESYVIDQELIEDLY